MTMRSASLSILIFIQCCAQLPPPPNIPGAPNIPRVPSIPGASKSSQLTKDQLFKPYNSIVTAGTKSGMSYGAKKGSSITSASYSRLSTQVSHPGAGQLFPDDAALSQKLTAFLNGLENDTYFLTYFAQLHILILHELYTYLTKIYTLFNVSHVNTIDQYVQKESTQALNKKTLIVNHLVNIIEAQLNSSVLAYFPALPQQLATSAGPTLMQHDYGADLNLLLEKSEQDVFTEPATQQMIINMRSAYLTLFGQYLSFFRSYAETLSKPDPAAGFGIPLFVKHAKRIQTIISQANPVITPNLSANGLTSLLTSIKKINPPLFFYDQETMRGLKIIPTIAQTLPGKVESIPWPDTLIKAAQSQAQMTNKFGNVMSSEPRAFFRDATGQTTTSLAAATKLYINIPTAQYVYQQEIIPQPSWLNSTDGVMKMLRACLGDFSALLDKTFADQEILDPCMQCIVANAASGAGITSSAPSECNQCQTFINTINNIVKQSQGIIAPPSGLPPAPPPIPSGM